MRIQGAGDLINPAWLEIPDEIYQGLMRDLRRELELEPVAPGSYLQLDVYAQVDGRIIGCHVLWGAAEGFFLPAEPEIPLRTRAQAAAQNLGAGFTLGDFLSAQHRVRAAPGRVQTMTMSTEAGTLASISCTRTLVVRFFSGREITVEAALGDTIDEVKAKIQQLEGIPPGQQQLYFAGTALNGARTLADYSIPDGATLNLVLRLRGGPAAHTQSGNPGHAMAELLGLDRGWGKMARDVQSALSADSTVVLCGPPGCGKATAVQHAATNLGRPLLYECIDSVLTSQGADMLARKLGGGQSQLADEGHTKGDVILLRGLELLLDGTGKNKLAKLLSIKNLVACVNEIDKRNLPSSVALIYGPRNGFTYDAMCHAINALDGSRLLDKFVDYPAIIKTEGATYGDMRRVLITAQMLIEARRLGLGDNLDMRVDRPAHNYFDTENLVNKASLQDFEPDRVPYSLPLNVSQRMDLDTAARFMDIATFADGLDAAVRQPLLLQACRALPRLPASGRFQYHAFDTKAGRTAGALGRSLEQQLHELRGTHRQHNKLMHAIHGNGSPSGARDGHKFPGDALGADLTKVLCDAVVNCRSLKQLKQCRDELGIDDVAASAFTSKKIAAMALIKRKPEYMINVCLGFGGLDPEGAEPLRQKLKKASTAAAASAQDASGSGSSTSTHAVAASGSGSASSSISSGAGDTITAPALAEAFSGCDSNATAVRAETVGDSGLRAMTGDATVPPLRSSSVAVGGAVDTHISQHEALIKESVHENFVAEDLRTRLRAWLSTVHFRDVVQRFGPVKHLPRALFSASNRTGELALYRFGQRKEEYDQVEPFNDLLKEVAELIRIKFDVVVNHCLINERRDGSAHSKQHQDQPVSVTCKHVESEASTFMVKITFEAGSDESPRPLAFTMPSDRGKDKLVDMTSPYTVQLQDGDAFELGGKLNSETCHGFPQVEEASGEWNLTFRIVANSFVNLQAGTYRIWNGKKWTTAELASRTEDPLVWTPTTSDDERQARPRLLQVADFTRVNVAYDARVERKHTEAPTNEQSIVKRTRSATVQETANALSADPEATQVNSQAELAASASELGAAVDDSSQVNRQAEPAASSAARPGGVRHVLGRASFMLYKESTRRDGGCCQTLDALKQCWKLADDAATLAREQLLLFLAAGISDIAPEDLERRMIPVCKDLNAFCECIKFLQQEWFILVWKPGVKDSNAAGHRKQSYRCPAKTLRKALEDMPELRLTAHLPVLAGGRGGAGVNTESKLRALGCVSQLAGEGFATFEVLEEKDDTDPPDVEELERCVKGWTIQEFDRHVSRCILMQDQKTLNTFDRSFYLCRKGLAKYVEARQRAVGMLKQFDADAEADYSAFKWGEYPIEHMPGIYWDASANMLKVTTKGRFMSSELCKKRTQIYIGADRSGKTELQKADGRVFSRRTYDVQSGLVRKPIYFCCDNVDAVGVLCKDGTAAEISSYHLPDTEMKTKLNDQLSRDEIKTIFNIEEDGGFSCRYHPGVIVAGCAVTASFNAGKNRDGSIDWGFKLRQIGRGLEHLDIVATVDINNDRQKVEAENTIRSMSSDDRAILDRVIIYRIKEPIYTRQSKENREAQRRDDVADEMAAEEAYLASTRR